MTRGRCIPSDPEDALQLFAAGSLSAIDVSRRDVLTIRTKFMIAVAAAAAAGNEDEFARAASRAQAAGVTSEEIGAVVWELADQGIRVSSHILRFVVS